MAGITIKSKEEIEKLSRAAKIVALVHAKIREHIKPGISTLDLDQMAEEWILAEGAKPAFKGYIGYKHTLCISINEEVVHGIPSKKRILNEGDIVGIDCGSIWEAYYGDGAYTYPVGQVTAEKAQLLKETEAGLFKGIAQMIPGNRLYDIGAAIEAHAKLFNYGVVRDYVGHGIGTVLHEEPQVPNFGTAGTGPRLRAGMVFAIEPMFNTGTHEVKVLADGWTVVTKDGGQSAHFEHTVLITENEPIVLTKL